MKNDIIVVKEQNMKKNIILVTLIVLLSLFIGYEVGDDAGFTEKVIKFAKYGSEIDIHEKLEWCEEKVDGMSKSEELKEAIYADLRYELSLDPDIEFVSGTVDIHDGNEYYYTLDLTYL